MDSTRRTSSQRETSLRDSSSHRRSFDVTRSTNTEWKTATDHGSSASGYDRFYSTRDVEQKNLSDSTHFYTAEQGNAENTGNTEWQTNYPEDHRNSASGYDRSYSTYDVNQSYSHEAQNVETTPYSRTVERKFPTYQELDTELRQVMNTIDRTTLTEDQDKLVTSLLSNVVQDLGNYQTSINDNDTDEYYQNIRNAFDTLNDLSSSLPSDQKTQQSPGESRGFTIRDVEKGRSPNYTTTNDDSRASKDPTQHSDTVSRGLPTYEQIKKQYNDLEYSLNVDEMTEKQAKKAMDYLQNSWNKIQTYEQSRSEKTYNDIMKDFRELEKFGGRPQLSTIIEETESDLKQSSLQDAVPSSQPPLGESRTFASSQQSEAFASHDVSGKYITTSPKAETMPRETGRSWKEITLDSSGGAQRIAGYREGINNLSQDEAKERLRTTYFQIPTSSYSRGVGQTTSASRQEPTEQVTSSHSRDFGQTTRRSWLSNQVNAVQYGLSEIQVSGGLMNWMQGRYNRKKGETMEEFSSRVSRNLEKDTNRRLKTKEIKRKLQKGLTTIWEKINGDDENPPFHRQWDGNE